MFGSGTEVLPRMKPRSARVERTTERGGDESTAAEKISRKQFGMKVFDSNNRIYRTLLSSILSIL
jgi:hypothetical protein